MIAVCFPLCANAALSDNDASYLKTEMQSQLGRYANASLAESHASSASVKALAKSIAAQAGAATRELDAIAKRNGIPAAKHPGTRDSYHYSQLNGLHGKDFDRRFVLDMKIDDEMMSSRDQTAAKQLHDAALRHFAQHHQAALRNELKRLNNLHP